MIGCATKLDVHPSIPTMHYPLVHACAAPKIGGTGQEWGHFQCFAGHRLATAYSNIQLHAVDFNAIRTAKAASIACEFPGLAFTGVSINGAAN